MFGKSLLIVHSSWKPISSAREMREPLDTEAATKRRLMKTVTENTNLYVIVICKV
jgi:hypothetical protein